MFNGSRRRIQELFENGPYLSNSAFNVFVESNESRIRVAGCYTYQNVPVCVNMLIFRRHSLFSYSDLNEKIGNLESILSETSGSTGNPLFRVDTSSGPVRQYRSTQGSEPDKQLAASLAHCVSLQDSLDRVLLWALDGDEHRGSVILGIHITASIRKEDGSVEIVGPVYTRLASREA